MMRRLAALALLGPALLGTPAYGASRCDVPHELIEDDGEFPVTAATVTRRQPVRIVAIGGAVTAGSGASAAMAAYPMRLQAHLSARLPGHTVMVFNRAMARQTAAEMAARFTSEVLSERPTLVVWETGTVDAVRGVDLDAFTRTLSDGIARLRAGGVDVMLVDPQYSPRTLALMNLPPYLEAVHMVADATRIDVFNRFDVMRHWTAQGRFDMTLKPPELTAEIDAIYDCIGQLLAQIIVERLVSEGVRELR
ncbi:MAG: SGNH/GDSL hydrolase family protein [Proteobacteria bacterium]|nr:SGNH/GDSL hydrolase family protein [Pseudomonadota bacterium]